MTADTVGGGWSYALELACGLADQGVEVALATLGSPLDELQRDRAGRIPHLKVFESSFKPEWMEDAWRDVERAGDWLLGLEDRFAPDLVHLNGYVHASLPWSVPRVIAGHSCVLSWWEAVRKEPAPESWDHYQDEVRAGLAAADLVVVPSAARMASLVHHYGPLHRARVIHDGRDVRQLRPAAKEPNVFAIGRMSDEARNLEALESVAPNVPWPIFVAGDHLPEEQSDATDARPHHTRRLGRLSQRALSAWLGRSSIFVLPARYEPYASCVMDAALAGCALVLGDIPNLRELWRNRAVFVPPDDPEALEHALLGLIREPGRLHSLAAGARTRAIERTTERMVDEYLDAYSEVLAFEEASSKEIEGPFPRLMAV